MSSTEIATKQGAIATQPTSELAIAPGQSEFTDAQVAALAQLGVQDASPGDLQVFFHQAKSTGLDPFKKQIYMIGRKTKTGGYRGEPERWETKWTIQVGIDGYRLGGRRVVNALGIKLDQDGPYWHNGTDWVDVWLDSKNPPQAAKFVIIRDGERHVGIANYSEYVQTNSNGQPNSMWKKMPANQLAKCAEAAAWRHAFPDTFSGVVFEDAAHHTVIDSEVVDEAPKKEGGRGAAGLAAALGVTDEQPSESSPEPEQSQVVDADVEAADEPTKEQFKRLNDLFVAAGLTKDDKNGRRIVAAQLVPDRNADAPLTAANVDHIADMLQQLRDQGDQVLIDTVESLITEHDTEGPAQ
ncbi:RecT-like ssDNA binding protein [Gordonia phage Blueberry]|uniref:RecT-like ssDNA binding protein n=1 Tax=Gordonia phage Azula TaxID=2762397 RepID=A0A7G8LKU9_9CAUD|nr:RecT-like ssDNA annealing protein [Gordonia phage Blueberry]YP_010109986.1 RecT-like ssDNA annealing protein [Gordonia phage Azula]QGJ97434.1 RecT-like ssDNA binding protein [Gordonia phage Gambino]QZD97492.1 RecT-like ssDNA binding domain protein [Gordonia phage MissRona]ANA85521.1 RecT-like ssDNA binding protein [Gordonia phage Blueberry]QNJ57871.1 RecT-like ssDNA binding protein [Gordonia phage Azula]